MEPNLPDAVIKQLYCQKKPNKQSRTFEYYPGTHITHKHANDGGIRLNLESVKLQKSFFYHENPKWPPVSTLRVSSAVHHLWSHVLYGSTERIRSFVVVNGLFTQTKVWNEERVSEERIKNVKLKQGLTDRPVILMCPSSSRRILSGGKNSI